MFGWPTRLAKEQQIVLRTARRWVERYRKSGLAGLIRKERNDKDERRLLPELQEIMPVRDVGDDFTDLHFQ